MIREGGVQLRIAREGRWGGWAAQHQIIGLTPYIDSLTLCHTPPKTAGVEPGPPESTAMDCFLSLAGRLPRGGLRIARVGGGKKLTWIIHQHG